MAATTKPPGLECGYHVVSRPGGFVCLMMSWPFVLSKHIDWPRGCASSCPAFSRPCSAPLISTSATAWSSPRVVADHIGQVAQPPCKLHDAVDIVALEIVLNRLAVDR